MTQHLVLAGGGHAHLSVLKNLKNVTGRGHRVTLVSPSPFHYYSGMGPGMLAGIYRPEKIRFDVRSMALSAGAGFVEAGVLKIDPAARRIETSAGESLTCDVMSFNTGSRIRSAPVMASENVFTVKPIEQLLAMRSYVLERLQQARLRLAVIGGGPAGIETAGCLWRLVRDAGGKADITLVAGRRLLGGFPERARRLVRSSFSRRGVSVREGVRMEGMDADTVCLDSGEKLAFDAAVLATGIRPSPVFADSGLPTAEDGGMCVNRFLQCEQHPELFGGGDCICFAPRPIDRVGVYAVRQNPVLQHNLLAALEGRPLKPFVPQERYMLLFNMGDDRAVFCRGSIVAAGRLLYRLKDYIDRSFMKKFQDVP